MPKILDTEAYLDTVCDLLAAGHSHVPVTVSGMSMTPFLDPGDTVFLDLPDSGVQLGDVILFRRMGGQYVLHRVVEIREAGLLGLLGDAQTAVESVSLQQVCAVVTGARHAGKLLDSGSLRWRFFHGPWRVLRRTRPLINRVRNHIRRKVRRV